MLTDICAACNDSIVYIATLDQWHSATQPMDTGVCPATDGPHELAFSVG